MKCVCVQSLCICAVCVQLYKYNTHVCPSYLLHNTYALDIYMCLYIEYEIMYTCTIYAHMMCVMCICYVQCAVLCANNVYKKCAGMWVAATNNIKEEK